MGKMPMPLALAKFMWGRHLACPKLRAKMTFARYLLNREAQ
jgi:hypothetical protein